MKSKQRLLRVALLAALLAVLASASLLGQEYRGRVQGTVTDSSQGAIIGATVTLLNSKTGGTAVRQTNENGRYLFDLVEPGTYSIAVEFQGFNRFVQENTAVPSRADLTVNAVLKPGEIKETVSVTADAAILQFNTAKLETTVDNRLTQDLPKMHRNIFLLAQLDPAVDYRDWGGSDPFDTWGSNNMRIGGSGHFSNDLQVDGSPSNITVKTGYVPSPEMVQEVTVQQNALDAEYGHSSGSAISVVLKSGNNEYHGTGFFQGQRPNLNALENRVYRTTNETFVNIYGGTFSLPIIKNKLFNFVSYEGWNKTTPYALYSSVPTDLERRGDFSKTLGDDGNLRVIYDPWTTQTAPDGTITRTPFPNNIIPAERISPIAAKYLGALWKANGPAVDNFNTNNFAASTPIKSPYKNFSDRVDYLPTDKLRLFGRFSQIYTPIGVAGNPTGSPLFMSQQGANYNMRSIAGDATYTLSPTTVLNFHGGYHNFTDQSHYDTEFPPEWSWEGVFGDNKFYAPVFADPSIPKLIPRMSIFSHQTYGNTQMGPEGGYWHETPHAWEFSGKIAQQHGKHYLKAGADVRKNATNSLLLEVHPGFGYDSRPTAATYLNPDLRYSGDSYATFLLGAIVPTVNQEDPWTNNGNGWDSGSTGFPINISPDTRTRFYGFWVNDDWKVSRNLTLNLGLRYEYESPYHDSRNRITRALDLNQAIPELQGITMPDEVKQFYSGDWNMTGAFQFEDNQHEGAWDGGLGTLSPRIGAAYRLNDKTVLRAGYGRYVTPWSSNEAHDQLSQYPIYGYNNWTAAPPAIQGVPQMRLSDPFPASNPVAPSYEKSLGIYTMLGNGLYYFGNDRRRSNSDRFNISVQRQLPGSVVIDVTYFRNHTSQVFQTDYNINQVDPMIGYTYKEQTLAVMDNPFYNQFPVEKFPGDLRYQPQVDVTSMAKPYPHYGDIIVVDGFEGGGMTYNSLQIKFQKNYSHGLSLLGGYNYHLEKDEEFFDDIASYKRNYTWQNAHTNHHRITAAGTWDIPFGKGRAYMTNSPRVLDAVLGGWKISSVLFWRSGQLLDFGSMVWNGKDPRVSNPTPERWFDTSVFQRQPDYTPRTSPWDYPGLMGPGQFNMDASLVKEFRITERLKMELKADAFNVINNMSWGNPDTSFDSSNFGQSTNPLDYTFGRRMQLGVRLEF